MLCGHNFCESCLRSLPSQRPSQRQQRWACPVCRKEHTKPISNYPRNYFIEGLVDKFKNEQLVRQQERQKLQQLEKQKEEQLRQQLSQHKLTENSLRDELREQHLQQLRDKQQKQELQQKLQLEKQKEEQLIQQLSQHQLNENSLRDEKQQKEKELEQQSLVIKQLIDQQLKNEEKVTKNNEKIVHELRQQNLKQLKETQQKEKELEENRLLIQQLVESSTQQVKQVQNVSKHNEPYGGLGKTRFNNVNIRKRSSSQQTNYPIVDMIRTRTHRKSHEVDTTSYGISCRELGVLMNQGKTYLEESNQFILMLDIRNRSRKNADRFGNCSCCIPFLGLLSPIIQVQVFPRPLIDPIPDLDSISRKKEFTLIRN